MKESHLFQSFKILSLLVLTTNLLAGLSPELTAES